MKNLFIAVLFTLVSGVLFAQQAAPPKFALVIGNGDYAGLSRLANPVNDANDISASLRNLGFNVDTVLNGNLDQMENAVLRLRDNLKTSKDAYGFFFYAGHGVQSSGENYLIPVNAQIPSESYLRNRALSMQAILDDLNEAENSLNVVVLDACRDNPFGWSRSSSRGLAIISRQPVGSIIVYATSAGQQAADGEGRNGLFTGQLLSNLSTPGLEVSEIFRRTGADVSAASNNRQIPAIYSQFFGTAYLGEAGASAAIPSTVRPARIPNPGAAPGAASRKESDPSRLWTVGASAGSAFAAPWMIMSAHGTIAPFRHSFLELGMDVGLVSGDASTDYYSLYPFAHYAFFLPFAKAGVYAGAGGGLMIVSYTFSGGEYEDTFPVAAVTAGVNILDMIDISYTLRTNFTGVSQRIAVGYTYRFK